MERVSCNLRMVSCESWTGGENCCLESFAEPNWSLLTALWSTGAAVLEPRGSFWKHLGIIFGHLCLILSVQACLGMIFNQFSRNFGSQNGSQNCSREAKKHEVASGTDFNRFLRDFGSEMNVSNTTNCALVECDVKCMSTFHHS